MDPAAARSVAHVTHRYARDATGELVIEHVRRVAAAVPESARVVAWLHDVGARHMDAIAPDAPDLTAVERGALGVLRQLPAETFEAYMLRLAHAPGPEGVLARAVKLAELDDHIARGRTERDLRDEPPYQWARRHIAGARPASPESVDAARSAVA